MALRGGGGGSVGVGVGVGFGVSGGGHGSHRQLVFDKMTGCNFNPFTNPSEV